MRKPLCLLPIYIYSYVEEHVEEHAEKHGTDFDKLLVTESSQKVCWYATPLHLALTSTCLARIFNICDVLFRLSEHEIAIIKNLQNTSPSKCLNVPLLLWTELVESVYNLKPSLACCLYAIYLTVTERWQVNLTPLHCHFVY